MNFNKTPVKASPVAAAADDEEDEEEEEEDSVISMLLLLLCSFLLSLWSLLSLLFCE